MVRGRECIGIYNLYVDNIQSLCFFICSDMMFFIIMEYSLSLICGQIKGIPFLFLGKNDDTFVMVQKGILLPVDTMSCP